MKKTVTFFECEHEGDLQNYVNDLQESGATIISYALSGGDSESGKVLIEVDDDKWDDFLIKFKETDSIGFSNLRHP